MTTAPEGIEFDDREKRGEKGGGTMESIAKVEGGGAIRYILKVAGIQLGEYELMRDAKEDCERINAFAQKMVLDALEGAARDR
jgi:hypothetical protein